MEKKCKYRLSYPDSIKILDDISKKQKAISRIMDEMMESDMEQTNKAINKALYDMAEQKHLSLYDLCFHTVPEVSEPRWDDATKTYSKTISIVPVEFDLTHDGRYWKEKYFQLKKKMQDIPEDIQRVINEHFDEML